MPCSAPRWPAPATASSRSSAVSRASRRRAETLLPGRRCCRPTRSPRAADLLVRRRAGRRAARPGPRARRVGGIARRHSWSRTPAGAHGAAVLDPLTRAGALPLALHPVMTFTGTRGRPAAAGRRLLRRDRAGAAAARRRGARHRDGRRAGVDRRGRPRPLYHAALAVGANHLVTLVAQSADMLRAGGRRAAGRGCSARCWARRWTTRCGAATPPSPGPVARGDAGTVRAHLARCCDTPESCRGVRRDGPAHRRPRARRRACCRPEGAEALLDVLSGGGRRLMTDGGRAPAASWRRIARRAGRHGRRRDDDGRAARGPRAAHALRPASAPTACSSRSSSTRCSSAPGEDFDRYPRTLGRRPRGLRAREGVDVVFAPTLDEIYPDGEPAVRVDAGAARRPARGRAPAGPLRRGAHRRAEAAAPRPGPTSRSSARRTRSSSR